NESGIPDTTKGYYFVDFTFLNGSVGVNDMEIDITTAYEAWENDYPASAFIIVNNATKPGPTEPDYGYNTYASVTVKKTVNGLKPDTVFPNVFEVLLKQVEGGTNEYTIFLESPDWEVICYVEPGWYEISEVSDPANSGFAFDSFNIYGVDQDGSEKFEVFLAPNYQFVITLNNTREGNPRPTPTRGDEPSPTQYYEPTPTQGQNTRPTPTDIQIPSRGPTPTDRPRPSSTPQPTRPPEPTPTPQPTPTPTPDPTPTPTPEPDRPPSGDGTLERQDDGSWLLFDSDGVALGVWTLDDDGVWVFEEFAPLASLDMPKTGGTPLSAVLVSAGAAIIAAGALRRKKRKAT
ncbi:MAG: hypothetical protein FWF03_05720, partial [Defluviitaleaceae bacterium]|nr:hypothetical protein [Defluviitaleaceae bacterium]